MVIQVEERFVFWQQRNWELCYGRPRAGDPLPRSLGREAVFGHKLGRKPGRPHGAPLAQEAEKLIRGCHAPLYIHILLSAGKPYPAEVLIGGTVNK